FPVKQSIPGKLVLLLLVLFISALFLAMIRHFLMAILLAGIFSALSSPLYRKINTRLNGRRAMASILTLLFVTTVVLLPLITFLGIVTAQAIKVGKSAQPWIEEQIASPAAFSEFLSNIPFYDQIEPYKEFLFEKAGQMVGVMSGFLIDSLSAATMGTVNFLFLLFVLLYTMFFFLMDGNRFLERILYYLPLQDREEQRMLEKFTSVTRATLKGTAIIGILQGGLAGIAFAAVGIEAAAFWGTVMTVLSIIPAVGSGLIWVPAAIYLAFTGKYLAAAGLTIFCALLVGSIDNFLRPRLVGKDTEMHDLLILFSTLGGITMFGVVGIIIGPIIAALFTTIWDIYGMAFREYLPHPGGTQADAEERDAPDELIPRPEEH
ncbi:MAG: AI-2E family transporter, partial [Desulfovibrionales bacterium]